MLIKFDVQVNNDSVPYHIIMDKVPFNSDEPMYYFAVFGNNVDLEITTFGHESAEQCLQNVKKYLERFSLKPLNVTVQNILLPEGEFEKYIANLSE